jgi:DsbC/DsbD-like thiol-disulfide interchange protein
MARFLHQLRLPAAAFFIACAAFSSAWAGSNAGSNASAWDGDARSAVRLIAGSTTDPVVGMPVRAGVEIRLKPGWHTYWRYPGDAGVPPRFDFAESENVDAVSVLWPAPRRIAEQGSVVLGYTDSVILPVAILPKDPSKAVVLHLKLDYAICEKLCVPTQATAQLVLPAAALPANAALAAAHARVPKKRAVGAGSTLAIASVQREDGSGSPRILVEVAAPPGVPAELFVEGPDAQWALPVPRAIGRTASGLQRFTFDLDGAPAGAAYADALITLTAVAGEEAIEVTSRLP